METGDSGREANRKVDSPTTDVWSEKKSPPPLVGRASKKSGRDLHVTGTTILIGYLLAAGGLMKTDFHKE